MSKPVPFVGVGKGMLLRLGVAMIDRMDLVMDPKIALIGGADTCDREIDTGGDWRVTDGKTNK